MLNAPKPSFSQRPKEQPHLSAEQAFFVAGLPEKWQEEIPETAKPISFQFGEKMDLDWLNGQPGKEGADGVIGVILQSSAAGTVTLGLGADWWCEAYVNGELCGSTMADGNGNTPPGIWNHAFQLKLRNGRNLLAIRIKRGRESWSLICKPLEINLYGGPIPWVQGNPPPPPAPRGGSYRIILLGDTHFDTEEADYHAECKIPPEWEQDLRSEFARNAEMWKNRCPRLLAAAARQVTPQTRAIIQAGDLIQGDCGNPEVHKKMLLDTLHYMKKSFPGIPFLTVTGNHDLRGTGAAGAYRKVMPEYLSRELNERVTGTTFYFYIDEDQYLFIDFNAPDMPVILAAMRQRARRHFVVSHGPVLPCDSSMYRWFLLGSSDALRRTITTLFMQNDVIVLTGHVHDVEFTECVTTEGRLSQVTANSVWSEEALSQVQTLGNTPADYGTLEKSADAQQLFREYKPSLTRYWKAQSAGFFVLDVSPDKVTAQYFGGDAERPAKEFSLR